MTRFADQLFDDLMRDHGQALADVAAPAARQRHLAARPVLMTAGAGGLAAVAAVGTLVATGGGSPAYAVTTHPDGTVTLAVYQQSGIAGANSKLHQLGDRVVVVPVRPGCPSISSLPAPAVRAAQISMKASGSSDGSVTVDARGVPAGDILVVGFAGNAPHMGIASQLASGPAPSCVSLPAIPTPGVPGGGASGSSSQGQGTRGLRGTPRYVGRPVKTGRTPERRGFPPPRPELPLVQVKQRVKG